jgi:hypothetical protein
VINDSSVVNELNKNKLIEEIITLPGAAKKEKNIGKLQDMKNYQKMKKALLR